MASDPVRSGSRVGALKILGLPEVLKSTPTHERSKSSSAAHVPAVWLLLGLGWQLHGPHECTGKNGLHLTYVVPSTRPVNGRGEGSRALKDFSVR